YLPKSWTDDPDRCAAAGIPATVMFATKPQLARRMIERAAGAAVPFAWVAGDEGYGDNGPLRTWPETQRIAYVLAVARPHPGAPPRSQPRGRPAAGSARAAAAGGAGPKSPPGDRGGGNPQHHPGPGPPPPPPPPHPPHRRPGLLPLLQPAAGHASRPGHGRRA